MKKIIIFILSLFPMMSIANECDLLVDNIEKIKDVKTAIKCVSLSNLKLSELNSKLSDEIRSLKNELALVRSKSVSNTQEISSTNTRINGISLDVTRTSDSGNWACGQTQKAGQSELVFMYGSRDGTGCGIHNVNYYKEVKLKIPQ